MDELSMARCRRVQDNKELTPEQLLEMALADLRAGSMKPDALLIIAVDRSGPRISLDRYRCGVTGEQELAYLELVKHIHATEFFC